MPDAWRVNDGNALVGALLRRSALSRQTYLVMSLPPLSSAVISESLCPLRGAVLRRSRRTDFHRWHLRLRAGINAAQKGCRRRCWA